MKSFMIFIATAAILITTLSTLFADDVTIPQLPGWPIDIGVSEYFWDMGGVVLADVDSDPELEIIAATSGRLLHVWDYDGSEVFTFALSGLSTAPAAVGDVNGDGQVEIVVCTRDETGGSPTPTLYVIDGTGNLLSSAVMPNEGAMGSAPTLADLDQDSALEIIVGERGDSEGWLHAFNDDLSPLSGDWPVLLDHVPATSAAAADIDQNGETEVVVCSFDSLYAMDSNGALLDGFPVAFPGETYSYSSPALADLDNDFLLEIVSVTHGDANYVHVIKSDGSEMDGFPFSLGDAWSFSTPAVGDVDGDGDLEIVAGRAGGLVEDYALFVLNHDGTELDGFPFMMEGGAEGNFVLADITGNGKLEIMFTSNVGDVDTGQGYVYATDHKGSLLEGWPLRPEGITYVNGPVVADADLDGDTEIAVLGSRGDGTASVNLYSSPDYSLNENTINWTSYQADNQHSGRYPIQLSDDDDDADVDDDSDNDDSDNDDGEECCG